MPDHDLPKTYDFRSVEERLYEWWETSGYFKPRPSPTRSPFVISIPPPNVTGELHLGHAMFVSVEDLMIRYHRMKGHPALWVPGSDHAGIATQLQVEKALQKDGLTREQIGREAFEKRVWDWKAKYGGMITRQLRRLGASCDWQRERFTLDDGLSKAVREAFVRLHDKGLIYRGNYLVNWSPGLRTAVSDLEVEYSEEQATLYYFRYPMKGSDQAIPVATTRPESILGDTAVAVHPEDDRYRNLVGGTCVVPILNREIPVIADAYVDREFGTGALKITPGHDQADYEIGQRHGLAIINVLNPDATMNENAGPYAGLDRYECRERIWKDMQAAGLTIKTEPYTMQIPRSQRGGEVVEPMVSTQWFVRMKPLAAPALAAVRDGRIRIVPERFVKVYTNWLENIRDWCVSRQLWWGHRIPAWHCADCSSVTVTREDPDRCVHCGSARIERDPDVLDTWFSSALWPFSTLGWPEDTPDLRTFYPTTVMETGYDILFFWVARMIMMGLEFTGQVPFHTVYLHGLIRDERGRRMSKTLGNGIDPLDVIREYGTDALRFTLAALAVPGMDLALSEERMSGYQAFANKIWNASRFVLMNLGEDRPAVREAELTLADRWVRSRLAEVTAELSSSLEQYKFYEAADLVYHFIWHEFCDWYIEFAKVGLREGNRTTEAVLADAFDRILRLLHPFMPFITEEIWQHLPGAGKSITVAPYPVPEAGWKDEEAAKAMTVVQAVIVETRKVRSENKIAPKEKLRLLVKTAGREETAVLEAQAASVRALAGLATLEFAAALPEGPSVLKGVAGPFEVAIILEKPADLGQEKERLQKEIVKVEAETAKIERKLENADFVAKAPAAVVEENRARLEELRARREKLGQNLAKVAAAA